MYTLRVTGLPQVFESVLRRRNQSLADGKEAGIFDFVFI